MNAVLIIIVRVKLEKKNRQKSHHTNNTYATDNFPQFHTAGKSSKRVYNFLYQMQIL